MKKIILCIGLCCWLVSCNTATKTIELTETFQSDSMHFSMKYPETWETLINPIEANTIAFVAKRIDSEAVYKENIVCWMEEMPMKISDSVFFQASLTALKISNPSLEIKKLKPVKLGENTFSSFTFDYQTNDSTNFEVLGFCLVNGKRGYNFACNSEKKDLKKHHPIFNKMLATFKPL